MWCVDHLGSLLEQQYAALTDSQRVVILHPNYASQHLILRLVPDTHFYVRFTGAQQSVEQLEAEVSKTLALYGLQLAAQDVIVLDEADRAQPQALCALLADTLLPQVKRGRILLLSRRVPEALLADKRLTGQVAFIPHAQEHMLLDYAQPLAPDQRRLEVWALGSGRVLIDGRAVENWDGLLPRSLFFFLVDRGMTTRTEVFATFWPNLTMKDATNVFHVTKRKISELLGTDLTVYRSGFYHLAPHIHLRYDVSIFNNLVQESSIAQPAEAQTMLRTAISMYRTSFLDSLQAPWAIRRRAEVELSLGDALVSLGRVLEQDDQADAALDYYLRAASLRIPREDAVERMLQLSRTHSRQAAALAVFRRYEQIVRDQLGISPASSLYALAEAIASGAADSTPADSQRGL
jgi:DNA-binding SARP family transcriptional activator